MEASNRVTMAEEFIDHSLDGQGRGKEIIAILSVFSALSSIVVALRIYTRASILRSFGTDDAIIIVALILTIGSAVAIGLVLLRLHHPLQRRLVPDQGLDPAPVPAHLHAETDTVDGGRSAHLHPGLDGDALGAAATGVLPGGQVLEPSLPGTCVDQLAVWYVMAGVNIITDFAIFIIPLPVIKSLQLPTKQKMLLVVVFGLGLFTCVISCLRIRTLKMASLTKDPNWDNTDAALWSFIELCIGVLTSSLPTLRPLIAAALPRQFGSSGRRGYQDYSGGAYGTSRSRALSVGGLGGSMGTRKNGGGGLPKSSTASDSLEELHQYKYGRDDKDLERAIGGGDATPGYSVNVSCDHDTFEMQRPGAAVVTPQSPLSSGAKRSRSQNKSSSGGGNGIVATTTVTREYEPSIRNVV
ncbi:hypothetical protein PG991_008147 [Apiospora marii]|uniref:Rhodopsin domain-containing protein n=1 Tax=Apiospora marii TaxID=335849 RepID=A0ABR1RVP7_9PEZI